MLAAFLCGLGLGSFVFAPFVPRLSRPVLVFGLLQMMIGLTAAASVPLFAELPEVWESTYADWEAEDPLLRKMALKLSSSFFIMLLPTLLMGMSFPVVCRIYVHTPTRVGSNLGDLYALNTGAAIFGSVAAGFWLIPWLGVQQSILLMAGMYLVSGAIALQAEFLQGVGRQLPGLTAALALACTIFFSIETGPAVLRGKEFSGQPGRYELLYVNEGAAGSLAVIENEIGTRILNINGIITAINNFRDMQVHRMLSHLPLLIHPDPKQALVVGFGMGSTVWGCCQHDLDQVDVVELMPAEKETAPFFADINHGVLDHEKLNFIVGDGRNYLLATPKKYDVISFNAIHPRFSANLYTRDFYELCMERMTDDGVLCAWLTQNSMLDEEWRGLCASLVEVFPHSSLWFSNPEHFCLIASKQELAIDLDRWKERMAAAGVVEDLRESNLEDPLVLITRFLFGTEVLKEYLQGAQVNTDDLPIIEFARESKRDEKAIAEDLVRRRESVLTYVATSDETERDRLRDYEESSLLMMRGQTLEWYDRAALPARIEYLRGLLKTPANQDLRHYLDFSWLVHRKVAGLQADNPEDPSPWAFLGKMLVLEGDLPAAEEAFGQALARSPAYPPALVELGLLHALADGHGPCVETLAPVVNRVNDPRSWYAYALSLEQLGRGGEAQAYRERALRVEPAVEEWFRLRKELLQVMLSQR
ncbi:MAG: fused MFS/spermidine synthase [Planctomycetota bacterium]|jgi:spermidine synthase